MAASCREILKENFPSLDSQVFDYIVGLLEGDKDEFGSADDIYDTVGEMLLQSQEDCTQEKDIIDLCDRFYELMTKGDETKSNGIPGIPMKILDAPVHLGSLAGDMVRAVQKNTSGQADIMMATKECASVIDQRKLDKAEAKIKQKQDKRSQQDTTKAPRVMDGPSVSQMSSKRDTKMDASGQNKIKDVRIENFDISYGERVLLQSADLNLAFGRRYGLVGRNGIGKTTLLRMLSSGDLVVPSHITILHVEQEVVGDDTLALESVLECDTRRSALLQEEAAISAKMQSTSPGGGESARLSAIYVQLEAIEADKAPARAAVILSGLGFTPHMQTMPTREFSGGWRMRIALARALFTKPDLLLLDEPTNMLDMKAIIWLENYLQSWPTTMLVVSHDREFLNTVSTDVLHLVSRRLENYRGNYENFLKTREEKLKNQQREYDAQMDYRKHAQVFIDKFRYNAKRASLVQSKLKQLEKLPILEPVEKESSVVLKFPECEVLNPPCLRLDEVSFGYSKDRILFNKVDLTAASDSRICIVGDNGSGKTTLLKILVETLEPTSGLRHGHRNLRLAYFSQHHVDQLDMNMNSIEVIASKFPGKTVEEYRNILGGFGVSGELATRPVLSLSGGQKSRLAFAQMSMSRPNFLVFDEPTNHLDMESIEALAKALTVTAFKGGVVMVTHDERLVRMVCTELWVCKDGEVKVLEGGIDEYKALVNKELAEQS